MLGYRKVDEDNSGATYEFLIEGRPELEGHVHIDKSTGVAVLLDRDPDFRHRRYGAKLMSELERQIASSALEDHGTLMWC